MTADLMPIDYEGAPIRFLTIDGEPWAVAADVASALGYSATSAMTRSIDADDKGVRNLHTLGGEQEMTVISEAGLYVAIIGSRVEGAQRFKRWLTREVLPQIRRTGSFGTAPALTEDQIVAQALQITARRVEQLEQRVTELEPPAQAWEHLASTDGDLSVNEAAKILCRDPGVLIGERRLWKWMDEHRWTYRDSAGDRRAYQDRIESGHLGTRARGHHHPSTGEWIVDAPQVRVTMRGIELLRRHLTKSLTVVSA